MSDKAKAREFLTRLFEGRPKIFFKRLDERCRGLHVIMHLLNGKGGTVVAGDIAEELNMSTPRVAAALKALEGKGYVVRRSSEDDRRKTVVVLTDAGRAAAKRDEESLTELVEYLFETVGESELNEFLRISSDINAAICNRISVSEG